MYKKDNNLRKTYKEIKDFDEDYLNILLRTLRHTEDTNSCIRYKLNKKTGKYEMYCRFNFPHKFGKTTLTLIFHDDGSMSIDIKYKTNDN